MTYEVVFRSTIFRSIKQPPLSPPLLDQQRKREARTSWTNRRTSEIKQLTATPPTYITAMPMISSLQNFEKKQHLIVSSFLPSVLFALWECVIVPTQVLIINCFNQLCWDILLSLGLELSWPIRIWTSEHQNLFCFVRDCLGLMTLMHSINHTEILLAACYSAMLKY